MRVDVPTLRCDRCKKTTQDQMVMGSYQQIVYYGMMPNDKKRWDLCLECWTAFKEWVGKGESDE